MGSYHTSNLKYVDGRLVGTLTFPTNCRHNSHIVPSSHERDIASVVGFSNNIIGACSGIMSHSPILSSFHEGNIERRVVEADAKTVRFCILLERVPNGGCHWVTKQSSEAAAEA